MDRAHRWTKAVLLLGLGLSTVGLLMGFIADLTAGNSRTGYISQLAVWVLIATPLAALLAGGIARGKKSAIRASVTVMLVLVVILIEVAR